MRVVVKFPRERCFITDIDMEKDLLKVLNANFFDIARHFTTKPELRGVVAVVDDMGKIVGKRPNVGIGHTFLAGEIVFVNTVMGEDGEDFCDLTPEQSFHLCMLYGGDPNVVATIDSVSQGHTENGSTGQVQQEPKPSVCGHDR